MNVPDDTKDHSSFVFRSVTQKEQVLFLDCWSPKTKALRSLDTSGTLQCG